MSHSEFGHTLRRFCVGRPARRSIDTRRIVRHDIPPHASVEMLWKGPGIDTPDDDA